MKRKEIVERIAEDKEIPHRTAGDWLDTFLHELLDQLKEFAPEGRHPHDHDEPKRAKGPTE